MDKKRNRLIATNIKKYIRENNTTQKELSKAIGISPSTMSDYMNLRSNPSHGVIQKIADHFGILKSDIDTTYKEQNDITTIYNSLDTDRQTKVYNYAEYQLDEQNTSTVNDNVVSIEDYHNEIELNGLASAGTGILDLDPEYTEIISYKGKLPNYYDFAFKVSGSSMEATFFDGDIIFLEKMSEVINGALMVVQIDDETFIKKVYKSDHQLRLVSLNKEYKDILADGNNEVRIVGKVVF